MLYIIDDGSADNTISIIEKYCQKYKNIIFLQNNYKGSKSIGSFMWLVENIDSDYYFFSDHDDVWVKNKVELTLNRILNLESLNPNTPIIVHSDLIIVDKNLNLINNSFWNFSKINPNILNNFNYLAVHNGVVGCTMAFNKLAKLSIKPQNETSIMHDSWITLNVLKSNGIVNHLNQSLTLYRQHEKNVIGAKLENISLKLLSIDKLIDAIINNYNRFKMINTIQKFNIVKYVYFKLKYYLIR